MPMPAATISSRPITSQLTPCSASASSRARAASACGVMSLAGAFCRSRGAFGVEALAIAEAGDDPALALGMGDREVLELGLGLARVEQRLQLAAGRVVGDALAVEHADGDGVGVGIDGCGRGERDLHKAAE